MHTKTVIIASNVALDERNGAGMRVLLHYLKSLPGLRVISVYFERANGLGQHGLSQVQYVPLRRFEWKRIPFYLQTMRGLSKQFPTAHILVLPNDGTDLVLGHIAGQVGRHVTVWLMDDFVSGYRNGTLKGWIKFRLRELLMKRLYRGVNQRLVISELMDEALARRYGCPADSVLSRSWPPPLIQNRFTGIDFKPPLKMVWMGHFQPFYSEPLNAMALLSEFEGCHWTLDFYGSRPLPLEIVASPHIRHRGEFREEDTLPILSQYQYGLVTYSFDQKTQMFMQLSLPGKLTDYVCAGLPVFFIGPADLAVARYIREHNIGYVLESSDSAEIRKALVHLSQVSSEQYQVWQENCLRLANQRFDFSRSLATLTRSLALGEGF